jgi:putative copper resistance protein D
MTMGLVACAISIVLSLWTEAAVMGDVAWLDAGPAFSEMLTSTHYGHAGLAAVALLVLAMFVHWRRNRKGAEMRCIRIVAGLVLLVAAARVSIGHASEQGLFSVAAWVEWLHVLLMSLWAGTVFVAGWIVLPQVLADESSPSEERAAYLNSLSNWATAALVGILATGAYNTYRVLGSPRDLIEGDYGHVLVFKLCFVLAAIALGGFNRFQGLPAAMSAQPEKARRGLRSVIAVLRIESIALLLVLAAAAILTSSAPPG